MDPTAESTARNVPQLDKRSELTDNRGDEDISTFSVHEEESREVPPASGGAVRAQRAPVGEGSAGNVVRTQRCQDEKGNAATIAHANNNDDDDDDDDDNGSGNDSGNDNDINDDDDNGESIAVASVAGGETASHNAQQEDVDGNLRGEGEATESPPVPETLVPMPVLDAGAAVANERSKSNVEDRREDFPDGVNEPRGYRARNQRTGLGTSGANDTPPLSLAAPLAEPKLHEARVSLVPPPSPGCRGGGGVALRVRMRRDQPGLAVARADENWRAMDHDRCRGKDAWAMRPCAGKASDTERPKLRLCGDAQWTRQHETRQAATRSS